MPVNNITLKEIPEIIKAHDRFVFLCHRRPDGDTLGSALALKNAAVHLGKQVDIVCDDQAAPNTRFLFEGDYSLADVDCRGAYIIAIDIASPGLLGTLEKKYGGIVDLKIDHHDTGADFAKLNYTDPKAAACGEIIYEIIKLLGTPLCLSAEPLYAAVSSDTGGFRYSNTTARTHRIAAELIECGFDHAAADHMLFENRTQPEIRALCAAYGSLKYFFDGKVAVISITNEMKEKFDLIEEDLGFLNSLPREIYGVTLGITIKQDTPVPSLYKLSLRSTPEIHSNELCAFFGGGGHIGAAGAEITAASAEEVAQKVMSHIELRDGILRIK